MEGAAPIDLGRHVYQLKWWAQAWYLAWGVVSGGLGVLFIVSGIAAEDWRAFADWRAILILVVFSSFGYFLSALALRSRLMLEGTRISVRYAFFEKSADLSEISGCRNTTSRSASFWRLQLKEGRGYISILKSFRVDDDFRAFLSKLKNLDGGQSFVNLPL
jgi:hypothetical protein